jgi:uncharacterized glyoxalase superfamily protein PhnB
MQRDKSPRERPEMSKTVTPMIHVPNVRLTVAWYETIGFSLIGKNEVDGEMDWALVRFGDGVVMFSEGGRPSSADRREVDLYVHAEKVDELFERLKDHVEIHEGLHETFYGMRESIVRDINRFWITFGEPVRTG